MESMVEYRKSIPESLGRVQAIDGFAARHAVLLTGNQDPLLAEEIEPNSRESLAQGHQDADDVAMIQSMQLNPLLQDPTLRQARFDQGVELVVVKVRRASEPDAGQLNANDVVALAVQEQKIASVSHVHVNVRSVDHAVIDRGKVPIGEADDVPAQF